MVVELLTECNQYEARPNSHQMKRIVLPPQQPLKSLIQLNKTNLYEEYELKDVINLSMKTKTDHKLIERLVRHIATNSIRFVKIYKKDMFESMPIVKQLLLNEFRYLQKLKHPNIISIHDFYEEPKYLFVIYDYLSSVDMLSYMIKSEIRQETHCYYILIQIARAIAHMHSKNICHRDIRPELIKISDQTSKLFPHVTLTGFQNAKQFEKENDAKYKDFTNKNIDYCAPEVIKGKNYSEK